ncbi:MAG: GntR family transcriptional regulator [Pseudonocardia sp.]|uniref:GntR family transcriptional regulator n=1 Tax=unclassified Pseudonocardia TaxID=2619320 RepID=UPI000AF4E652|nr:MULTISPECIES: GntR family transcriptional regulator [unclassified Pseudonocardia]MBN9108270.1 GntR family transcriptional regulator [Pseudonocardia sp.]RTL70062.1 MAG: GntR family transcriptional regulator [Pseudonocardiaceae bacterium]
MSEQTRPPKLGRVATYAGQSLEVLRGMILDGTLAPAERINEVHLSQALGISRGPLREAIQRLASEGLVEAVPHRGVYVRSFSARELSDLYELRVALETHAVRLAARYAPQQRIDELGSMLDETESSMGSASGAYPEDPDFHARLARLAANPPLVEALTDVGRKIRLARARSAHQPRRARTALDEHREILAALVARDGEGAAAKLEAHLTSSLNNALAVLRAAEPD